MKKRFLHRFTLAMTLIMTGFFGFPGLVAADASISNTGPDSYNKIEFDNENECKVHNDNDVDVNNVNFQNAQTGDASVGSQWGAYAPEAWQARGASYEEWHAAVSAHMAEYQSNWGSHGGGNTNGGDATSGDATNVNNTKTNVNIDNSGACGEFVLIDTDGDGKVDKKVPKQPGHVLGSTSSNPVHGGGAGGAGGHVLGASSAGGALGVGGQGGAGGAFNPTTSGGPGAGGPGGHGGHGANGGNNFSIDTTGPDSFNKISVESNNSVKVHNNNDVNVVNVNKQSASSGNASVSGNTNGGSAGSGGAANGNGTNTGAGISN